MAAGLDLNVLACRLRLSARRTLDFPVPASNRFRGALGFQLPEELFRPTGETGPSGLRDRPRPFVLRCHALDGRTVAAGTEFSLDLHLFTADPEPFQAAFDRLDWAEVVDFQLTRHVLNLGNRQQLSFSDSAAAITKQQVLFMTPTELKPHTGTEPPPFSILLARACERISALRSFYGDGPLAFDFRTLAAEAGAVRCAAGHIEWQTAQRRSGRTAQVHPLGGFTGFVEYEGALGPFRPWLEAATWTGVGRQTVWGKGLMVLPRAEPPVSSTAPPRSAR